MVKRRRKFITFKRNLSDGETKSMPWMHQNRAKLHLQAVNAGREWSSKSSQRQRVGWLQILPRGHDQTLGSRAPALQRHRCQSWCIGISLALWCLSEWTNYVIIYTVLSCQKYHLSVCVSGSGGVVPAAGWFVREVMSYVLSDLTYPSYYILIKESYSDQEIHTVPHGITFRTHNSSMILSSKLWLNSVTKECNCYTYVLCICFPLLYIVLIVTL